MSYYLFLYSPNMLLLTNEHNFTYKNYRQENSLRRYGLSKKEYQYKIMIFICSFLSG